MSVVSNFGRQPSYESITHGERKGFSASLIAPHPNYSEIATALERKALVENLADHVIGILDTFVDENLFNQSVQEIMIGKTFAGSKKKQIFEATNPRTWIIGGISSRWSTKYNTKEFAYDAVIPFECFVLGDVPDILRTVFGMNQQDFGLKFEELVMNELKTRKRNGDETLNRVVIKNGDEGGGGRDGCHTGTILYVAVKLTQQGPLGGDLEAIDEEGDANEDEDD